MMTKESISIPHKTHHTEHHLTDYNQSNLRYPAQIANNIQ